jgi:uracil phosphoribosyltransferase
MVHTITHPLIQDLVNRLRDIRTDSANFRHLLQELSRLLLYEALKDIRLHQKRIPTWLGEKEFGFIDQEEIILIPILRAGLPMLEGALGLLPKAKSGFLAMKRDEETLQPTIFYKRFPKLEGKTAILLDPMLATGGSLSDALDVIKKENPKKIFSLNIIAAPEGVRFVNKKHPEATIYVAQIDQKLNDKGFIVPGLGDAGDRAFHTE